MFSREVFSVTASEDILKLIQADNQNLQITLEGEAIYLTGNDGTVKEVCATITEMVSKDHEGNVVERVSLLSLDKIARRQIEYLAFLS